MSELQHGITFRPARAGDGTAAYHVTWSSVRELGRGSYSPHQLEIWMGSRTPVWHENLITNGDMIVAERSGKIVGFVHTVPGEINRLFVLPDTAGKGLGKRLLEIGIENARKGHSGPIKLVSLLNAVGFYERLGFRVLERGYYPPEVADGAAEMIKMEF